MFKKITLVLVFAMFTTSFYPSVGMSWNSPSPRYDQYRHYPYQGNLHYRRHGDEALFWGLTGLFLGTVLLSAFLQPPRPPVPMVYGAPKSRIYTYPPAVPPGMCRWERYILDNYGRMVLDQYGHPVKEYTLGSCQYPPY